MGSVEDRPVTHLQDFQAMFDEHFKPPTHKPDTKPEEQKEKKGGKDENA